MSTRLVTAIILIVVSVALIVWDIYAAITPVHGDTISEVLWTATTQHPVIPFLFGMLMGHLFWQR